MPIEKIIVLEDDLIVRKNLEQQLRSRRYDVAAVETIAAAEDYLARDNFDLLIADIRLPDGDATDLLKRLNTRPVRPLVVMISGFATVESAVECMKAGAFDYLIKPFSAEQLEVVIRKAAEFTQLLRVNQFYGRQAEDEDASQLLGQSKAMEDLRQLIRRVARTEATVLIQGESGTGKELVARALHQQSPRNGAPFIKVNCAAIPENLIESEFFGHEKGAFTGALAKREGRFELAHGGTILLDEISEISPAVQAKLLRVLQEREFERVGGNRTVKVDVRVIATTNRHLEQSVARKEFRQDLFFRLNVVPVQVPPLRQRKEDILLLARHFMQRFMRKHGVKITGLSPASESALLEHDWPGNVRELQNVIERAVILGGDSGMIEPEHLGLMRSMTLPPPAPAAEGSGAAATPAPAAAPTPAPPPPPPEVIPLAELEKRHILAALEKCGGNRTHAARLLGISVRTLRNKLHEYNPAEADKEGEDT
jgi:Nif-specific regulatory protein